MQPFLSLTFTLLPQGIVDVDYETSFESVGINQINYKIWITISVDIKMAQERTEAVDLGSIRRIAGYTAILAAD